MVQILHIWKVRQGTKKRRKTKSWGRVGMGKEGVGSRLKIPKCYILYYLFTASEEPNCVVYNP